MARTRTFDEQAAVEKAMRLFWRRGYASAPLPDLLTAMGLSRGSFYNAFGGKRAVLIAAVRHYMSEGMDGVFTPLFRPDAGRAEIEATFQRMIAHVTGPEGRNGCLVNNCMTELAAGDREIRRALLVARGLVESGFARAVERGQKEGTISSDESPIAVGRFLLNTFAGLNVAAKGRPPPATLRDIARVALRILDR